MENYRAMGSPWNTLSKGMSGPHSGYSSSALAANCEGYERGKRSIRETSEEVTAVIQGEGEGGMDLGTSHESVRNYWIPSVFGRENQQDAQFNWM